MTEVFTNKTTYVTQFTAGAPGAIAVLRIWGTDAIDVADRLFRPKHGQRGLRRSQAGELRLGWFGIDEVVALVVPTKGESTEVEIQGHGSPILVQSILQSLQVNGVEVVDQDDYLKSHGVLWLERKAREHFNRVSAPRAAEVLWRQVDQSLRRTLEQIQARLEDGQTDSAVELIDRLIQTADWGTRLSCGFTVALAGAPNVGKSTLVNALAGYERVLVSPVAGTTRDLVDVALTIQGWPIVVTDTAGLRDETADPLEAAGMALAYSRQSRSDLVIRLFEAGGLMDHCQPDDDHLTVLTKLDLCPGDVALPGGVLAISAQTGQGLDVLMRDIVARLIPVNGTGSESSIGVVFDSTILQSLEEIMTLLLNQKMGEAIERIIAILEL